MSKLLIFLWTMVLIGCATDGVSVSETNYSLNEVRSAIISISGELREISQNQREYFTQYFSKKKDPKFNPSMSKERAYAHFLVLGERRPYEIRVIVITEKLTKDGYVSMGEDKVFSKKISDELFQRLHQSRDGRNVIDDFRPF